MISPRSLPLIVLVLATVVLVVEARVVLGGKTWDDVPYHTEVAPSRLAAADAVLSGHVPAWWDGSGLGVPLVAEPSHGAAYPITWIAATPHALDLVLILHLLWLAIGIAQWARGRGASEIAAATAGVLIATSGVIASAAIRGALPALSHVPWIAWAASQRRYALVGVFVGLVALAGELGVLVDACVLAILIAPRANPSASPRLWTLVGVVMGLAIGALQWGPALFSIPETAGASVSGLAPARWIDLLIPAQLGSIHAIGGAHAWFPGLYIGAPLLAFAALGKPTKVMIGLGVALVVAAFTVGRGGWPSWSGAPELHLAVLALIAAPHAAIGLDVLLGLGSEPDDETRAKEQRRAFIVLGSGAVVTAIALGALGALRARIDTDAQNEVLKRALLDGGVAVACIAGAVIAAWRAPESLRALIVIVLILAPNIGAQSALAPMTERGIVDEAPAWARSAVVPPAPQRGSNVASWVRDVLAPPAPVRVFRPVKLFGDVRDPEATGPVALEEAIGTLAGTSAARYGVATARSDDPARAPDHDRVWLAAAAAGAQLLSRFGISLAILPRAVVDGEPGVRELGRRGTWSLVQYAASPPAAIVYEWLWIPGTAAALERLFPPGARKGLDHGVVVLRGTGSQNQDEPSGPEPCTLDRWEGGAIDLSCTAHADAYAVISSSAAQGWSVTVDGQAARPLTADVVRRAVALPAGSHRVAWRYAVPGLTSSIVIAALGVVGLFALWLVTRRAAPARG